jgi:hypothetical protein
MFMFFILQSLLTPTTHAHDLSLKNFRYHYNNGAIYVVCFLSDQNLSWNGIQGDDAGNSATENYIHQKIDDQIYLVGWTEKSKYIVSQVLNLKQMTIHTHLTDINPQNLNTPKPETYELVGVIEKQYDQCPLP